MSTFNDVKKAALLTLSGLSGVNHINDLEKEAYRSVLGITERYSLNDLKLLFYKNLNLISFDGNVNDVQKNAVQEYLGVTTGSLNDLMLAFWKSVGEFGVWLYNSDRDGIGTWGAAGDWVVVGPTATSQSNANPGGMFRNFNLIEGESYTVEFSVTAVTTNAPSIQLRNSSSGQGAAEPSTSIGSGTGTHVGDWTFTANASGGAGGLYIRAAGAELGDTITINYMRIKKA